MSLATDLPMAPGPAPALPRKVQRIARNVLKPARRFYNYIKDCLYTLQNPDSLVPSEAANFVGGGDFEATGQEFKRHFIELAGLQPDHRVLDVGSGLGRMAVPLTDYLGARGSYEGIELVSRGVRWCQQRITPRFPNFRFQQCDVYNKMYNPRGKCQAKDYRFPFENNSFDFVFLTSVFTHMLPPDVENYTREISRVLKPNGKCLITFFIMNQESRGLIEFGRSSENLKLELDGCYTIYAATPETAIGYDQKIVEERYARCGLSIVKPMHFGSWCGRDKFVSYQDIVVAEKSSIS